MTLSTLTLTAGLGLLAMKSRRCRGRRGDVLPPPPPSMLMDSSDTFPLIDLRPEPAPPAPVVTPPTVATTSACSPIATRTRSKTRRQL